MAINTLNVRFSVCTHTTEEWAKVTTVPLKGELCVDSTTLQMRIGDGVNTYDKLKIATVTPAEVADTIKGLHTHENKAILDATTASFTVALLTKLNGIEDGATKNNTKYTNSVPATATVGGIQKGYVAPKEGIEAIDLLEKILHPYVAPSIGTVTMNPSNGGVFQNGTTQTVESVSVTLTLGSEAVSKIEILDGSTVLGSKTAGIATGANAVSLGTALTISGNKTLTIKVTDASNKTYTKSAAAFTFVDPIYYGAIAADATPTEANVTGLTKVVQTKGAKTQYFTCANQKMVFAYPASYGGLAKIIDQNNFDVTGTFTRTTITIGSVSYYAYSNDASTVTSFKMTFNF